MKIRAEHEKKRTIVEKRRRLCTQRVCVVESLALCALVAIILSTSYASFYYLYNTLIHMFGANLWIAEAHTAPNWPRRAVSSAH